MENKTRGKLLIFGIIVVVILLGVSVISRKGGNSTNSPNTSGSPNNQSGSAAGRPSREMDYASIAKKLNLSEDAVKAALTPTDGQRLNLEQAASTLGVSVDTLREAIGIPSGMRNGGTPPADMPAPPSNN